MIFYQLRVILLGFFLGGVFVLSAPFSTPSAHVLELGMTPSNVYALWARINDNILLYARTLSADPVFMNAMGKTQPHDFEGKTPKDVLVQAKKVHLLMEECFPVPTKFPDWLIEYQHVDDDPVEARKTTPSSVFLESLQILNAIAEAQIDATSWEQLVSDLYDIEAFDGKTPSDVFGLVDLAHQRMVKITKFLKKPVI